MLGTQSNSHVYETKSGTYQDDQHVFPTSTMLQLSDSLAEGSSVRGRLVVLSSLANEIPSWPATYSAAGAAAAQGT
ncbi:hypothetical protein E6O75_ATG09368 [Venturia nashicola]|uniref:Uncharacterized protein n=1 Tax=Venturia nashicola TaxID=86259 RepID=A0A4Z1NIB2_9PEZI|nr:hypothetical protein E6O75_ATG09368 [Venturia nashicola]